MSLPYAIVPGAAVWPNETPSPTLRRRAERAAALYHAGSVAGVVASGGLGQNPPTEAEAIRRILTAKGVPDSAIILEDRACNTLENIAFSKALLPEGAAMVIVTDAWHLPRARLTARRLGLPATGAPASLKGAHPGRVARAALREAAALIWYLVRPMRP